MATNDERTLRNVLEKLELLTGERSDGSRRAVLISELNGLMQDLSDENVAIKKSIRALEVEFNQSSASFKEEILLRADENSALAQIITTLRAQVRDNIAQIQETKRALATKTMAMAELITSLNATVGSNSAEITSVKTVYADDKMALAQDLQRIEATAGKQRTFRQTTAPNNTTGTGGNNLIVGDLWFDTDDNNKPYYWTGSAWENVANLQDLTGYATTASVTEEQTARVNADRSVAQAITAATAGTARVYTQTTAPSSSGRLNGDVWYDASVPVGQVAPAFTPYVWYNGAWRLNTSGEYTKYVGQIATISQSLTATTNALSVSWSVLGTIDGATGGLRLTGLKKADGTGATYDLIIDANTTINGTLIVNGSINVNSSGESPIAANAISDSAVGFGNGSAEVWVAAKSANDTFLAIATYVGGDTNAIAGINGSLQIQKASVAIGDSAPIRGFATSGVASTTTGQLFLNYQTASAATMAKATAGMTGAIKFNCTTGLSAKVALYVVRLAR